MTQCVNCGRVLTTAAGERLHSANFTTELPCLAPGTQITWARCNACHDFALSQLDFYTELARIESAQKEQK